MQPNSRADRVVIGGTVRRIKRRLGRGGLAFVDPHRDSWATVAPYLAHPGIMRRAWLVDLTIRDPQDRLACWNPLSMTGAQASYLKTLSEEAGEEFDPGLTKAEASRRIDAMREKTGHGR